MISSEKIKAFLTSAVDSIKSIVKTDKKEENNEIKNAVKNKTDENSLVDTSKLEENDKKESKSNFKRILLGIATLGVSEIVRKVKDIKEKKETYDVNGEINQKVSQGEFADCVLIASIYALSQNKKGAQILKDAININYDENGNVESYTIDYKGVGEKVTVTKEELDARNEKLYYEGLKGSPVEFFHARDEYDNKVQYCKDEYGNKAEVLNYSTGDDDMLLLEIGWEKLCKQAPDKVEPRNHDKPLWFIDEYEALKVFADVDEENFLDYSAVNDYQENYIKYKVNNLKGEFKLSDIGLVGGEPVFVGKNMRITMDENDTYTIQETDSGNYLLKNKTKNEEGEIYPGELQSYLRHQIDISKLLEIKDKNYDVAILSFNDGADLKRTNGENYNLSIDHAYAVKKITNRTITIINPYNTSEDLTFTLDEFAKASISLQGYNIK